MTLVQFTADVYPYCKGDVVELSDDAKKVVDKIVEGRENIESAYKKVDAKKADDKK